MTPSYIHIVVLGPDGERLAKVRVDLPFSSLDKTYSSEPDRAPKRMMTRKEASAYICATGIPCSHVTLNKYACVGGGPEFFKNGKLILYSKDSLDRWISDRFTQGANHK